MWSCPDTQSEETQSLHSLYFSPFPSPFPHFSHSFLLTLLLDSLLGFCPSIFNCAALLLGPLFLYVSLPDIFLDFISLWAHHKLLLKSFFPIVSQQVTHFQQEKHTHLVFHLIYTLVLHTLSQTSLRLASIAVPKTWSWNAHKETWEERGLSPPIKPDRRSRGFFHVLNSSLPSTWIN